MKDPVDDTYKLIEINPRAWMQIGYPSSYGIHLPHLCYQSSIPKEKKVEESTTDDKKVHGDLKWIYLFYDIRSCLKRIKKNELRFQEVFDSYACTKQYGVFSWRDPMPFVVLSVLSLFELLWFPFHYILQKIR